MKTKFIFFSGKGGVGKTSMACTTAVYNADKGLKTLIVTTDPASNLSDVFEQEIGHKITKIDNIENLYAMEINPDEATREYKERSLAPMRDLFDEELIRIAEEQLSGPCTEEMASFDRFIDFMEEETYEVIVFDTAPTGHTIRLLELPVDWSRHIEEASKGSGQTCMGPVALIEDSKQKYDDAIRKLRDIKQTEFIFVMQPEQTSLEETLRSSKELERLDIKTSQIIINGLIPEDEAVNPFFKQRFNMQRIYTEKAKETFSQVPIINTMELLDTELKGVPMFRLCSEKLFKKTQEVPNIDKLLYPKKGGRKNIFFSGKGGVGKTSLACITAVQTANKGFKTLLITTDPAAHIGNVLDKPVTEEVTGIEDVNNLFAVKIDAKIATEEYKKNILEDAKGKFNEITVMAMEEELNSPCTEEMAAFQKFIEYASSEEFEVVVFDTAPTGHTLRLLELPMNWSNQIQMKAGVDAQISEQDRLQKERFDRVIEMMKDIDKTTFAFVMYPEKTPVVEAFRASQELATLGIQTQLAVANLVIPEEQAVTPFFKNRRSMQLNYLNEIKEAFNEAEMLIVPMYEKEIKGIEILNRVAKDIY